jgi:hypothetical protein
MLATTAASAAASAGAYLIEPDNTRAQQLAILLGQVLN